MIFGSMRSEKKKVKMKVIHPNFQFEEIENIDFDNPGRQKITLQKKN
jgi:hypothetical protein